MSRVKYEITQSTKSQKNVWDSNVVKLYEHRYAYASVENANFYQHYMEQSGDLRLRLNMVIAYEWAI